MYGAGGFFRLQIRHYLAYFKPGFHPSQYGSLSAYQYWLDIYQQQNDPLAAGLALQAATF